MQESDIGIYRFENNDDGKGKMAMKVLDYMATGLPSIISPVGISPHILDNEHALFAKENSEWIEKFKLLIVDENLRARLGNQACNLINTKHDMKNSFDKLLKIIKYDT